MKKFLSRALCAFFFLGKQAIASENFTFKKKWGGGQSPIFFEVSVSKSTGTSRGGRRTIFVLPALKLNSSMNIACEMMQRLFMPRLTMGGVLKTPTTDEEKLSAAMLEMIKHEGEKIQTKAQSKITQKTQAQTARGDEAEFVDPDIGTHERYTHPTETHQFGHFHKAHDVVKQDEAILIIPGSKKTRITELHRAQKLAGEGYAVFMMDQLVSDHPEDGHTKSTIANQLDQSLDAAAFNVQLTHLWLQNKGYNKISWECESVGSIYAQHALDPSLLSKMPPGYKPPVHIHFNDCPQPLVSLAFDGSLLKDIPLTISIATEDDYTSKAHVEMFLKHLQGTDEDLPNVTVVEHKGYHDQSLKFDAADQKEEAYYLADATVYSTLMVSLPSMQDQVHEALTATLEAADVPPTTPQHFQALLDPLMGRLGAIDVQGNIFSAPKLYVHKASIIMMQERLITDRNIIIGYRGSLSDVVDENYREAERVFITRFKRLFGVEKKHKRLTSQALAYAIGLPESDVFVENQHVLTQYVLRSETFKEEFKRLNALKKRTDEDVRRAGLKDLLELLQLRVSDRKTSIQLAKKVNGLIESADVATQITRFQSASLFNQTLEDDVEEGVWVELLHVPQLLSLLPKGAIFGATSELEARTNETALRGRVIAGAVAAATRAEEEGLDH